MVLKNLFLEIIERIVHLLTYYTVQIFDKINFSEVLQIHISPQKESRKSLTYFSWTSYEIFP